MKTLKKNLGILLNYIKTFLKWLVISAVLGALCGAVGSAFHISVDAVTELRKGHREIVFLLPAGGVLIAALYKRFSSRGKIDTNRVLDAIRENAKVPFVMGPLIFVSTVITHLFGGSAGREGAALQLGGGIGYKAGKLLRQSEGDMHIIVRAGMSSVFSALFGTPLTAAVFALEVTSVGTFHYAGLLPCIIASATAFGVSHLFGVEPVRFAVPVQAATTGNVIRVIILAVLCAAVSILFCTAIHKCEQLMKKATSNKYAQAVIGGAIIVLLSLLCGTGDYNGAGMDVIGRAMGGKALPVAFLFKILFTAITIAAGFKGGEIVPAFFVGATFGCVAAPVLGLSAGFGAAIGFVSLFCAVVNCPIASLLLAIEVFGGEGTLLFAIACSVSYMMSGSFSLYKSQRIVYSKLYETAEEIN